MDLIQTTIMGLIQGLSEFLPISSSGHLVFCSNFYQMFHGSNIITESNQEIFLDIMLHLGTLIAVLLFFKTEITQIVKEIIKGFISKDYSNQNFKLGMYIILGTFISVLAAYIIKPFASKLVFIPNIVGILLCLTGFLLIFSEFYYKKLKQYNNINLKNSIIIAIFQGLAVIPGFSRSGLTISAGLLNGIERKDAARYSFLLSIPIILGASLVYPLIGFDFQDVLSYNLKAIFIGTIVSGITGYFCIKYFLKFISSCTLSIFGWYCLLIGTFCSLFFSLVK